MGEPSDTRPDTTAGGAAESGTGPTEELPRRAPLRSQTQSSTTFSSPLDALHQDEIRRSRLLGIVGLSISGIVAATVPFLQAPPFMYWALVVALFVVMATNAWLIYLSLHPARYATWKAAIIWVGSTLAISVGVIFFGVYSPAPMVLLLGIYFISLGTSFGIAFLVYIAGAVSLLAAGLIFALGLLEDPGMVHADYLSLQERLIAVFLIQVILLFVFLLARSSHRTTVRSMTEFDQAVRAIAQREALLHEARQDLERALRIGDAGRFTGQTLGSFVLGNVLGRGAMGEVYEARTDDGRSAAVKLLQPAMLGNPGIVQRFLREVEIAAALHVEHVVRVLEVSDPQAPFPYLAMELLQGKDLAEILRHERRLSPPKVAELVDQVGRGVHAAGQAGIVHRDLKPQNLFLSEEAGRRVWKILDFGVSKLGQTSGTLTQGNLVGTPMYMAPEQAASRDVDHRADLYALAAIAYRSLTGHLPFHGKDVPAILYRVVYEMPPRPSSLVDLPRDVDSVMSIALAKDPAHRFPVAAELAAALAEALRGELGEPLRKRGRRLQRDHPWRND